MTNQKHITECCDYLSQGDIFRFDLVAPFADPEKFIFRTIDGKNASLINPDGLNAKIFFEYDELISVIESIPKENRIQPFQRTNDGKFEMVLVYAELLKYFIIISQTCDISGINSQEQSDCVIIPIITLAQYFQEQVPVAFNPSSDQKDYQSIIIYKYITDHFDDTFESYIYDDHKLPNYWRDKHKDWRSKSGKNSQERNFLGVLKSAIDSICKNEPKYLYYIMSETDYEFPECFADFRRIYTLPINIVKKLKDHRIATLNTPYREEFAKKFADYYARIATPHPMRGETTY